MPNQLAKELAQEIVNQGFLANWNFWLVLCAIVLVACALSAYSAAYFARKAQTAADKADRQVILDQLRATTQATEQVRAEILHADWHAKEWKTIRRVKLEELFSLLYEAHQWESDFKDIRVFKSAKEEAPCPRSRFEIVCRLYFPELLTDVQALTLIWSEMSVITTKVAGQLHQAQNDVEATKAAYEYFQTNWQEQYKNAITQMSSIEKKAPELISSIFAH